MLYTHIHTPIIAFSRADGCAPLLEQFCVWGVTAAAWLETRPGGLRGCYKQHLSVEPRDLEPDVALCVSNRDRLCRTHMRVVSKDFTAKATLRNPAWLGGSPCGVTARGGGCALSPAPSLPPSS